MELQNSVEARTDMQGMDILISVSSEFYDASLGEIFNFAPHRTCHLRVLGLLSDFGRKVR